MFNLIFENGELIGQNLDVMLCMLKNVRQWEEVDNRLVNRGASARESLYKWNNNKKKKV